MGAPLTVLLIAAYNTAIVFGALAIFRELGVNFRNKSPFISISGAGKYYTHLFVAFDRPVPDARERVEACKVVSFGLLFALIVPWFGALLEIW